MEPKNPITSNPDDPTKTLREVLFRRLKEIAGRGAQGQVLKTPVSEIGVDLDPTTPGLLRVSSLISRAWSTLWGWTGANLIRLRASTQGHLVTTPAIGQASTTHIGTDTLNGTNWIVIDLGVKVNWVLVYCIGAYMELEVSHDNVTYQHRRISIWGTMGAGSELHRYEGYLNCRYVRVRGVDVLATSTFTVIGEQFI